MYQYIFSLVVGKFDENSILLILKADIITCSHSLLTETRSADCNAGLLSLAENINALLKIL